MKKLLLVCIFVVCKALLMGQHDFKKYAAFIKRADSLYHAQEYKDAAFMYTEAFKSIGWKGAQKDRYNAACAWALTGVADSAFFQLDNIATKANFIDYEHIMADKDLQLLHADTRWQHLLEIIQQNRDKATANFNKPVVAQLDTIFEEDQRYRRQMDTVTKKYGWESKEMKALWKITSEKDSLNLIKVKNILGTFGWPGPDVIGERGSETLFLVIQHSDPETQKEYLPVMRDAVKKGKAAGSLLALLEDRVALAEGKKQIYGSQIGMDKATGKYYILPLEDPGNVDKRRAAVGLPPLSDYASQWQIHWDVEQYKKELQKTETKKKAKS